MVFIALNSIGVGGMGFPVARRVRERGGSHFVHWGGGQGPACVPNPTTDCLSGGGDVIGAWRGSVLVHPAEGGLAALRVLAPVLATRPLAVDKEAGMEDTLKQDIFPAVWQHEKWKGACMYVQETESTLSFILETWQGYFTTCTHTSITLHFYSCMYVLAAEG